MTSQEPRTSQTADQLHPDTEVISVSAPSPVFVDATGRRSRLLRRIALAFGVLVVAYGGLLSVSLAGGPVTSSAGLPLPGLENERDDDDDEDDATPQTRPSPTPEPRPSTTAPQRYIVESLQRRVDFPPRRSSTSTTASVSAKPSKASKSAKPSKSAAAKPKPATSSPAPSTTKPVESTTSPKPAPSPPASSPATPKPSLPVVVPPAPPEPGTGGTAGGDVVAEEPEPKATSTGRPAATQAPANIPTPPSLPQVEDDPVDDVAPSSGTAP